MIHHYFFFSIFYNYFIFYEKEGGGFVTRAALHLPMKKGSILFPTTVVAILIKSQMNPTSAICQPKLKSIQSTVVKFSYWPSHKYKYDNLSALKIPMRKSRCACQV